MPTPVTMYKAADGTLFQTAKDAVTHERAVFFQHGLTPLLRRLLTSEPNGLPQDLDGQAATMVAKLADDEPLLNELRKFFTKAPATCSPPVARKRARKSRSKPVIPSSPLAPDSPSTPAVPFAMVVGEPTADQLDALDSLAGTPIVLDAPPAPPELAHV